VLILTGVSQQANWTNVRTISDIKKLILLTSLSQRPK